MGSIENSLPIIQSLWVGKTLTIMERLCISSFLKNGHTFHLYTYDEIENAPKGTILKDANTIIPSSLIFKYKDRDTYAGFSNIFRYKLIYEKGNFWVDMDIISLKPFMFNQDYIFAGGRERRFLGFQINNFHGGCSVIKAPPESEILKYSYEITSGKNSKEILWGEIGPKFFETAIKKFGLESSVADFGTFSTVEWQYWYRFISNSLHVNLKEQIKLILYRSHSIHLYNEMWRLNEIDKNASFPKTCIYEKLKRKYDVH
ncbi:MAG: hypothetical protein AB7I96_01925 [Candidatus Dadabacteria bacterium]